MFPDRLLQEAFLAAEYSLWETPVWFPCPETMKQRFEGTTTRIPWTPGGNLHPNSDFCTMKKRKEENYNQANSPP